MDVIRIKALLTAQAPMKYKECREFSEPLAPNDRLEFQFNKMALGTCSIPDLPTTDAVLLIVVGMKDFHSAAASFESHVFTPSRSAQVAAIEAYKGSKKSTINILTYPDPKKPNKTGSGQLPFCTAVSVKTGLENKVGQISGRSQLVIADHENYIVLRVGLEGANGTYPEEIFCAPNLPVILSFPMARAARHPPDQLD
ncbi:unnamed protein product [Polarella glacialis]|uniref:Uncharacterized protein n=1 Tax=Polarella glacialis TaxID=89957 RepID=A0A813JS94_POLGL|nr:unnamed protein product [Polarella glacialis]